MRSIAARFLLTAGVFAVLFSAFVLHQTYSATERQTMELHGQLAALALEFDLAIRKYVGETIRPIMTENIPADEFIPETMSTSFVARSIFEKVRRKFPDYVIKFSSDDPRNPANKADPSELKMIKYFNDNPEINRWAGKIDRDSKEYFAHFSARRMKEKCLRCHGQPEDAPASLLERYGTTAGFHRPVGEVIALDTIAIPMDKARAAMVSGIAKQSAIMVAGLGLFFGAIAFRFRSVVARRITLIAEHFRHIADQPESAQITPVAVEGRDEISVLAAGFNALADRLRIAHASLEQRVSERTNELAKANEDLHKAMSIQKQSEEAALNMMEDAEKAKTAAEQAERKVRESEERHRAITETAQEAIITADADGNIRFWNPAAEKTFGFTASEAVGTNMMKLIVPPQYREAKRKGLAEFGRTGHGAALGKTLELSALRKGGSEFPIDISLSGYRDRAGFHAVAVIRDVTERKRAEEELQQAKKTAEAANRSKSEFLANMSHEIRTPMNGVIGMTELALDTELNDEQREYLHTVLGCSNSLLTLLNDILDFSKIEAGKLELETVDFDLAAVVEGAAEVLTHRATEKNLELICNIHPDVPTSLRGDPTRLRQVLVNLAGNAIKFTERGEVVVSVGAEKQEQDRVTLLFAVHDTGIGIPEDRQAAIFDNFTQADGATTRKYGGTGLGLSISKQIVRFMGGEIWLESEPGRGSTFFFSLTLPLGSSPAETPKSSAEGLRDRRVLVVDDNLTNLTMLQASLEAWGCRVTTSASGEEALKLLRTATEAGGTFDLVLLDVQMPKMDGLQVAQAIGEDDAYGHPPIILSSSLGTRNEIIQNREIHCAACLTKPLKQTVLKETIIEVLSQEVASSPTSRLEEPAAGANRRRFKARILVVEDNLVNQQVAVKILEKHGCDVTTAENGRVAITILEQKSFDLVFMDVQMPEMDGFEATRHIRGHARWQDLPIIAMTAHAMKGDRERCLKAGMDDYITKPVKAEELQQMVEKRASTSPASGEKMESPERSSVLSTERGSPAQRPLDIQRALGQLGDDRELLEEAVGLFLDTIPTLLDELQAAVSNADAEQLCAAAHSLKGAASSICAEPTRQVAQRLEEMGQQNQLQEGESALADLQEHLHRLREFATSLKDE